MILGMLPMSLGLGEGGEQNAPLGRVVIGGLLLATFATLFFVPVVYSRLRRGPVQTGVDPELRVMDAPEAFVEQPSRETAAAKPRRQRVVVAAIVAVFVLLGLVGLVPRLRLWHRLATHAQAEKDSVPMVTTAHPQRAPAVVDVPLPGTTEPLLTTGIYARTDGYLKARYVDIGDRVTAGQLLAEIASPEVDQQLNQARATLAQGKANVVQLQADLALARTTLKRFVRIGVGAVTQQEIDDRATAAATRREGRRRGPGHRQRQPGGRRPPAAAARGSSASTRPSTASSRRATSIPARSSRRARRSRRPSSSASRRSIRCASSCTCRRPTHSTCASASPPMSRCVSSPIGSSREP